MQMALYIVVLQLAYRLFGIGILDRLDLNGDLVSRRVRISADDLLLELEGDALFGEYSLKGLWHLHVNTLAANVRQVLDTRYLGAKSTPNRTLFSSSNRIPNRWIKRSNDKKHTQSRIHVKYQLKTDDAAANNDHRVGHVVQRESACWAHNSLFVDLKLKSDVFTFFLWNYIWTKTKRILTHLDARKGSDFGSGGDQDVLGLDDLGGRVVAFGDGDLVGRHDRAEALKVRDLVRLEQVGNAGRESLDGRLFLLHQCAQIQTHVVDSKNKTLTKSWNIIGFFCFFLCLF